MTDKEILDTVQMLIERMTARPLGRKLVVVFGPNSLEAMKRSREIEMGYREGADAALLYVRRLIRGLREVQEGEVVPPEREE